MRNWQKMAVCLVFTISGFSAHAGCLEPFLNDQLKPIALPGDPKYDPDLYGRAVYERFDDVFEASHQKIVIATITPLWDRSEPLPHEKHRTSENAYQSSGQLYHQLIYNYPHAYDFVGSEVTAEGLIPIANENAGLRMTLGEGYSPEPFWTEEPALFAVLEVGRRLLVEGAACFETTWPVPTDDAMDVLTSCIANNGCVD